MLWWVVNLYVMFGEKGWNEGEWRSSYTLDVWRWKKTRRKRVKKSIFLLPMRYSWSIGGGLWIWSPRESSRKLSVFMNQGLISFQPEKQCFGLIQPSTRTCMMCKTVKVFLKSKWIGTGVGERKYSRVWKSKGAPSLMNFPFPKQSWKILFLCLHFACIY